MLQLPLGFEIHFVGARFSNEVRGAQQALKRSGVSPPAFNLFPRHRIARDVSIVDVCDFEFAATGGFQSPDDVVHLSIVHVNADHSVVRPRLCGLLVDTNNALAVESHRRAKTAQEAGKFDDEVVPVPVRVKKETVEAVRARGEAIDIAVAAAPEILRYVVEKGSIAVDGISLTVNRVSTRAFEVSLIPHTQLKTTLAQKGAGAAVNLEVDLIGKYVEKLVAPHAPSGITMEKLREQGFVDE